MVTSSTHWVCDVCGRLVNRIFGMAGACELPDGRNRIFHVARGYCLVHRDAVLDAFRNELASAGEPYFVLEPIVDLRPRHVVEFMRTAAVALGSPQDGRRDTSGAFLCPYCECRVDWGDGPHMADASTVDGTVAWQCPGCGSAGLAYISSGG